MLFLCLLFLLFNECSAITTCERIKVTDMGIADGIYQTFVDYRGRPDFFTEDGVFNLFGEDLTATTCYWRLDNTLTQFPFYTSDDCSQHPVDITTQWFVNNENLDPVEIFPIIECLPIESKNSNATLYISLFTSLSLLFITIFLVLCHIKMRKKRISSWEKRCPLCTRRVINASNFAKSISNVEVDKR